MNQHIESALDAVEARLPVVVWALGGVTAVAAGAGWILQQMSTASTGLPLELDQTGVAATGLQWVFWTAMMQVVVGWAWNSVRPWLMQRGPGNWSNWLWVPTFLITWALVAVVLSIVPLGVFLMMVLLTPQAGMPISLEGVGRGEVFFHSWIVFLLANMVIHSWARGWLDRDDGGSLKILRALDSRQMTFIMALAVSLGIYHATFQKQLPLWLGGSRPNMALCWTEQCNEISAAWFPPSQAATTPVPAAVWGSSGGNLVLGMPHFAVSTRQEGAPVCIASDRVPLIEPLRTQIMPEPAQVLPAADAGGPAAVFPSLRWPVDLDLGQSEETLLSWIVDENRLVPIDLGEHVLRPDGSHEVTVDQQVRSADAQIMIVDRMNRKCYVWALERYR